MVGVKMFEEKNHQDCYLNNIVCSDECKINTEELNAKYSEMNRE